MTRQIVERAEDLFSSEMDEQSLDSVMQQVVGESEELAEAERQQLEQIARLMEKSRQLSGDAPAEGAGAFSLPGEFELTASDDRMFLMLTVRPPVAGGDPVRLDDVLSWLKQQAITTGVDMSTIRSAIDRAAQEDRTVSDVVAVRGRPPKPGRDARVQRYGRRSAEGTLVPVSESMLSPNDVWMCREGDLILRYTPPVAGEPGYNALGETIEAPAPDDQPIQAGRNVRLEDNQYFAQVNGVVIFGPDQVEVRRALILTQDLTRQSDPVDFDGEVHVRAAVRSGARVRATGNVTVDGPVEAAEIESTEADVLLRSGVAGQGSAVIRAARDVQARFAESASLFAGNDIVLQVGSLHARLIAHRQIHASQGKGHLAGGIVMAGERVVAKQLGARGGVRTDVTVGLSEQVMKDLAQIDQLLARATQRRDSAAELAEQVQRAVGDPLKLSPKELGVYTRLQQLQLVSEVQIRKLNERRRTLLGESARDTGGQIEVHSSIMPNVHVTIGSGDLEPEARDGHSTLVFDENQEKVVLKRG